ncbi:DNA repair protein RadC [Candidatus Falkowbacteria bacterium]|nr:DNA repair protein RadC [Candidatus Falkowbacteria bacterium]
MDKLKQSKPSYIGHRQRIKTKYGKSGLNGWLDYEVLELVLSYAIPRKDTKSIARELLLRFKSINGVLDADNRDLQSINGISKHTALFLNLLKDVSVLYMEERMFGRDLLSSPQVVYDYLKVSLKGLMDEGFMMLFLDNRNQLIAMETLKNGTVNQAIVFPRKIVERALYYNAVGVLVAHNHPSGSLEPSQEDQEVTKDIREALKTVDITLLDHIIIGGNEFFSFKENQIEIE